jgi:hypothetical protein
VASSKKTGIKIRLRGFGREGGDVLYRSYYMASCAELGIGESVNVYHVDRVTEVDTPLAIEGQLTPFIFKIITLVCYIYIYLHKKIV